MYCKNVLNFCIFVVIVNINIYRGCSEHKLKAQVMCNIYLYNTLRGLKYTHAIMSY